MDLEELYNYYADGEKVNVIYFHFTETLRTKWSSRDNGRFFTLYDITKYAPSGTDAWFHSDYPVEIYYLVRQSFWELNMPGNEVFYAQRKDGTLVWSGMIQ